MQNQENKAKVTYLLNGETVSKEEFASLVGEYFKWFEGSDVKAVDYSSVEPLFDGDHKTRRQINDHLKGVLGETMNGNSTRHKYSGEGDFHTHPLTPDECFKKPFHIQVPKPRAINQSDFFDNKQKEQEILNTFKRNMEGVKETEGKLNYELDWEFIQQLAERMNQNKGKYEPYNWTKPMDVEKLKQSLFRHVIEVMKGNYLDDGREFGHLESIALNAMMINYQLKNNK